MATCFCIPGRRNKPKFNRNASYFWDVNDDNQSGFMSCIDANENNAVQIKKRQNLRWGFGLGTMPINDPLLPSNLKDSECIIDSDEATAVDSKKALYPIPSWAMGDGTKFKVRKGPNYFLKGLKDFSLPNIFECVGCDTIRSDEQIINDVVDSIFGGNLPFKNKERWDVLMAQAGDTFALPRVLVYHLKFPYLVGPKLFGSHPSEDFGCSVVSYHVLSDDSLDTLENCLKTGAPLPYYLRAISDYFKRNSTEVMDKGRSHTYQRGIMKTMISIENLKELGVPKLIAGTVNSISGRPTLITKSGAIVRDERNKEFLEISMDIRKSGFVDRFCLNMGMSSMHRAVLHLGLLIQETEDQCLPERMLASVFLHNLDLLECQVVNVIKKN